MSEPPLLRLKRKATDDAPDVLILEPQLKRAAATKLHYVRKAGEHNASHIISDPNSNGVVASPPEHQNAVNEVVERTKREYHLSRTRKRDEGHGNVATFVEKISQDRGHAPSSFKSALPSEASSPEKQLRKPSARATVSDRHKVAQLVETDAERRRMEEMSEYMQDQFLEEVKQDLHMTDTAEFSTRSKQVKPPRLSGQRSKEIHRQRTAGTTINTDQDVQMPDESEFVYDTYILAPASGLDAAKVEAQTGLANVGYLVIDKEDESLWQTYLEDDLSDDDGGEDTEEDDENAEDFYGADYPEDELASDDEFDRNNYAYRGKGAFDEEYDEDTGAYSDDDDDEFERATNPLGRNSIPKRFKD